MEFRSIYGERMAPEHPVTSRLVVGARSLPRLLVFLLLLCFVVNGTALQSHVHFVQQANSFAPAPGHSQIDTAPAGKGNSPADCPLCQEAAMAGAYVLPAVPVLPPAPAPVLWIAEATLPAFALLAPAFGWLSRAPPE